MRHSSLTIGRKIQYLAATLVALSLLLGAITLFNLRTLARNTDTLALDAMPGIASIGEISTFMYQFRGECWKHIGSRSEAQMAQIEQTMRKNRDDLNQALAAYEKSITQDVDRQAFAQLRPEMDAYFTTWTTQVLPLSRAGQNVEAYDAYLNLGTPKFTLVRQRLNAMLKWNLDYGAKASAESESTQSATTSLTWMLVLGALVCGGVFSTIVVRKVNRDLITIVDELSTAATQVASVSTQVASSSQSLAQGANEQASSLEETSSSAEEINSMAQQNADHAQTASAVVEGSERDFANALQKLDLMVHAMSEIGASSEKISKIIRVIDEIAFQTNILALNAAVEAARAGEAGMGFAVVADEVRNLAQRCAQAARETSSLIEESVSNSTAGQTRVAEVGAAVRSISEEMTRLKTLVAEVREGSHSQTLGTQQISRALSQMEQVTQQSAAGAEEGAAASEQLSAQASRLKEVVHELGALVGHQA